MRYPPRAAIVKRVVALNQRYLVRALRILVIPSMVRVGSDRVCLARTIWVDQCYTDEVAFRNGLRVGHAERVLEDGADGAPDLYPKSVRGRVERRNEFESCLM